MIQAALDKEAGAEGREEGGVIMDVRTLVGRVKGEREERFVVAIVKADLSGLVYLSPKLTEPEVREYFSNQGTSDEDANEYLKVARTNPPV